MTDMERIRAVKASAEWWRREWREGRLNKVQSAVVLDDVLYWLETPQVHGPSCPRRDASHEFTEACLCGADAAPPSVGRAR